MRKIISTKILIYTFFVIIFIFAQGISSANALKKIGEPCEDDKDEQCESDDCEESDIKGTDGKNLWFCDCSDMSGLSSDSCEKNYGKATEGTWFCRNGGTGTESNDLDYCERSNGKIKGQLGAIIYEKHLPLEKNAEKSTEPTDGYKAELTDIQKDLEIKKPILEINLPGLTFTDVENTIDEEGYIYIPYLSEYISAVYKFGMIVISIVASVMIILYGAKMIVGGGEEKVTGLKKIGQVVAGLVIAWGSYAILYNINPDLVNFKALKVMYIKRDPIGLTGFDSTDTFSDNVDPSTLAGKTKSKSGYTITNYKQCSAPWGTMTMKCDGSNQEPTVCHNGCGFTSTVITLEALYPEKAANPAQMMNWYHQNKTGAQDKKSCDNIAYMYPKQTFNQSWFQDRYPGLTVERDNKIGTKYAKELLDALDQGKIVIIWVKKSALTSSHHYFVAYEYYKDDNGNFFLKVSDPGTQNPVKCTADINGNKLTEDGEIKAKIKSGECKGKTPLEKCLACGGKEIFKATDGYPLNYVLKAQIGDRLIFSRKK